MKYFKASASILVTLILIVLLQTKFGSVPPLGKFLNPATGFWQNAESKNVVTRESFKLPGLKGKVVIKYDEHRVPHIFADNEHDLYYAQGFVTARDRLWQMDVQTRQAAGRLAEIIGPAALETDRYHRRMGMSYGAENSIKQMMKDSLMRHMVEAYTDGINAYIHQLTTREYPVEFKLLDYKPEDWKPINCAYLLKLMSESLAGGSDQFAMTNVLKKFGAKATAELFPDSPFHQEPIIPAGTKWGFTALPIPRPSKTFLAETADSIRTRPKRPEIGSNNWAIAGSRTASGYPILENDPHLNLTFPSIWYQVQLCGPGVNVNGASLPGSPCVISGYNQNMAWGETNVGADVLDWYQVKFKDSRKAEYWYNNRWNKVSRRAEVINIRGQQPLYDTVLYTHHGPVVYEDKGKKPKSTHANVPIGDALRWIAHDPSADIMAFYYLNRAKNYADYRAAMKYFSAPAQNFIFASMDNDIAITADGKFPLKYKGQGKFILDGTDPADDWHGWVPNEQNPTVRNPARGFVSSANQPSTDSSYPYYINWEFGSYYRGKRINDRLAAMHKATVDSMRVLQNDTYSTKAQDVLAAMLKYIGPTKLDKTQLSALNILKGWDKSYTANAKGATIFDAWWKAFYGLVWDGKFGGKKGLLSYPSSDKTEQLLLTDPNSKWFDDDQTHVNETAAGRVFQAFTISVNELSHKLGQPGKSWEWGQYRKFEVPHLAGLAGFGSGPFATGGTGGVINATGGSSGPSWRMVVQLGPKVKGYGILPAGESGNPGSFYYSDMLKTWQDGKLNELLFLGDVKEQSARVKVVVVLE